MAERIFHNRPSSSSSCSDDLPEIKSHHQTLSSNELSFIFVSHNINFRIDCLVFSFFFVCLFLNFLFWHFLARNSKKEKFLKR